MKSPREPHRIVASIFWVLAVLTIPIWWSLSQPGWDAQVYARAMHWVAAGQDPYVAGIAQEENYYATHAQPGEGIPFAYVYSPMTLPLLKLASSVPAWLLKGEYWLLYALCALAIVLVTLRAAEGWERKWLRLMAPMAVFFPGLLCSDVIQSGNIAYIVYGLTLTTAWIGWRRNHWLAFYIVVVAASCFKAPYLSLLAIPFFSSRRQAVPVAAAAAVGVGLFAIQPLIWPVTFHHYLRAVGLQFAWNHDFGASPAGQLGVLLAALHLPFAVASWGLYLGMAIPVAGVLFVLGRRYQRGELSLGQWMPMLIVGTLLLNPRHIEYDLAPLTLPLALLALRLLDRMSNRRLVMWLVFEHFIGVNVVLLLFASIWLRSVACGLIVGLFAVSCWSLLRREARVLQAEPSSEESAPLLSYAMQKVIS